MGHTMTFLILTYSCQTQSDGFRRQLPQRAEDVDVHDDQPLAGGQLQVQVGEPGSNPAVAAVWPSPSRLR